VILPGWIAPPLACLIPMRRTILLILLVYGAQSSAFTALTNTGKQYMMISKWAPLWVYSYRTAPRIWGRECLYHVRLLGRFFV